MQVGGILIFFNVFMEFVMIFLLLIIFWYFACEACGILAPRPGIQPAPRAVGK